MVAISTLIIGLLIGFFTGAWACIIGLGDFSSYNYKCRIQWENVNEDEKDEVE